ncbi:L-arabinonate dehydratase domain protein [Acinetobacter baumannii 44327_1]|nr:L-arabinonate dehydratase domain protein [Acinetobacter baumannii 44327_1]
MAVGRKFPSPLKKTGNPTGSPPASKIPFFTCSAIFRKCALHGVSSDHVLQIPMIGLP